MLLSRTPRQSQSLKDQKTRGSNLKRKPLHCISAGSQKCHCLNFKAFWPCLPLSFPSRTTTVGYPPSNSNLVHLHRSCANFVNIVVMWVAVAGFKRVSLLESNCCKVTSLLSASFQLRPSKPPAHCSIVEAAFSEAFFIYSPHCFETLRGPLLRTKLRVLLQRLVWLPLLHFFTQGHQPLQDRFLR